jgi:hypothetical protein
MQDLGEETGKFGLQTLGSQLQINSLGRTGIQVGPEWNPQV